MTTACRVCGDVFFSEPLLKYRNMPAAAQYLPDAKALGQDRGADLVVRQCSGCGLVQLDNEPVAYFREVIRAAAFSEEMKKFRMKQFAGFVRDHTLMGKKIVEIGCGRGEYLSLMRECGADAYGIEHSEESVRDCRKKGFTVSKGYLENHAYRIEHAPFDAFYILNFLEHAPDVNAMLRAIRNNLTENGVGLVEAPNFDMILEKKLFSEFIGDHLLYFTRDTLSTTLAMNGFEVIDCGEVWHDYILSAVVRKRKRTDLTFFARQQERLKKELSDFISGYDKQRVAVWGAGHQALAVIALTDLSGKVKYVVDSAPFKQGKFTPATHIPIVPPDTLDSDPVDAVIVMAASYSDEVARTIQQRQGNKIHVAIVRDYGLERVGP